MFSRLRPFGHLRGQHRLDVDGAALFDLLDLLGGQHGLELGGDLPGLRGVRLVGDHREPPPLQRRVGPDLVERDAGRSAPSPR